MRQLGVIGIALTLALSIGCGKSDEQKAAEQAAEDTKKAAEELAKAAEKTAQAATNEGLSAAAKALEGFAGAMAGTGPDGKPAQAVSFQALQTDVSRGRRLGASGADRRTNDDSRVVLASRGRLHEGQVARRAEDRRLGLQPDAHRTVVDVPGHRLRETIVLWHMRNRSTSAGHPGFEKWNKRRQERRAQSRRQQAVPGDASKATTSKTPRCSRSLRPRSMRPSSPH